MLVVLWQDVKLPQDESYFLETNWYEIIKQGKNLSYSECPWGSGFRSFREVGIKKHEVSAATFGGRRFIGLC